MLLEHFGHGSRRFGQHRIVSWKSRRSIGHAAHSDPVFVAPGQKRCTGGRTDCRIVVLVKSQSLLSERVESGSGDRTAVGARRSKSHVVGQNKNDVRSILGRSTILGPFRRPPTEGLLRILPGTGSVSPNRKPRFPVREVKTSWSQAKSSLSNRASMSRESGESASSTIT